MVTRLFFPEATASEVNPAFGGWTNVDSALRRKLADVKGASAITIGTRHSWAAVPGENQLDRQYVSAPMNSGISFSAATVKLQIMTREYATADNSTSRLLVKIVNRAGDTIQQTLLALGQFGPATEYVNNVSHRNKTFADGDTVAGTYTTAAGDRIVVEIGHTDNAGTTPEASCKFGENATDLPENETQTTDGAGWIEFSNNITFEPTQVTKTITSDVIVKDTDVTKTLTSDVIVKQEQTKILTQDVIIKDIDVIKTASSDVLIKSLDIQKTLITDLLTRLQGVKELTADLIIEHAAPPPLPPSDIILGGGVGLPRRVRKIRKREFEVTLQYYIVKKKHEDDKKSVTVGIYPKKSKDVKKVQERAVEILLEYKKQVDAELDLANITEIEIDRK